MTTNKKRRIVHILLYIVWAVILVGCYIAISQTGSGALHATLMRSVLCLIMGGGFAIIELVSYIVNRFRDAKQSTTDGVRERYKRENEISLEDRLERIEKKHSIATLAWVGFGLLFVVVGVSGIQNYAKDKKNGPIEIVLTQTSVEQQRNINSRRTYKRNRYYLRGSQESSVKSFNVTDLLDQKTMDAINAESPRVVIIQYPETKAILQVQVYFDGGTVVVPDGPALTGSNHVDEPNSTDVTTTVDMTDTIAATDMNVTTEGLESTEPAEGGEGAEGVYEEIPMEHLLGVDRPSEGEELATTQFKLEHMWFEVLYEDGDSASEEDYVELRETYSIESNQNYMIYSGFEGAYEVIVIYDKESTIVNRLIARKKKVSN